MLASPKRSALFSGLLHAAVIAVVLLAANIKTPPIQPVSRDPIRIYIRPYVTIAPRRAEGGGGGGTRDPLPANKGHILRVAPRQFVPPTVRVLNDHPQLTMDAAIVALPETLTPVPDRASWGLPDGVLGALSNGGGSHGGIGDGGGGGVGHRQGPGAGNGDTPGGIGGEDRPSGVLTAPVLLSKIEPEYTEEARRAKLQGTVLLRVEVNERGIAQNISIRQNLGLGLDERAVEAVQRWRFRPGRLNGKPAVTVAIIEVSFRLL